ncbi:MAG: EFR1 family ferrodoxin [Clostridia bacterium]
MQEKVNATIIYFSPCKSTCARALELERQLQKIATVAVIDITKKTDRPMRLVGKILVVVLPIYNNSLPQPAKEWLQNSELDFSFALICLTYGGVSRGRAMAECAQILKNKNIALASGGFLPTNHCYNDKIVNDCNAKDIDVIKKLVDKALINGALIENSLVDKTLLNFNSKNTSTFASKNSNSASSKRLDKYRDALFPKPYTDKKYCISCSKCIEACPMGAINLSHITNEKCIHCNACVNVCETNARIFKISKTAKFGIKFARCFNKKYKIL